MTLHESLLSARSLSTDALGVWLVMIQHAVPTGAIDASKADLVRAFNSKFGRRLTHRKFGRAQVDLKSQGLIPSFNSVYPFGTTTSPGSAEQLERVVSALSAQFETAKPDPEKEEHARLCAAAKAVSALPAFAKKTRVPLTDPDSGDTLIVDGSRRLVVRWEWDYAYAQRLLSRYGLKKVLSSLFVLFLSDKIERVHSTALPDDLPKALRGLVEGTIGEKWKPRSTARDHAHIKTGLGRST